MTNGKLGPTQKRILRLLQDGKPHKRDELLACLDDKLAGYRNLQPHLVGIKKVLRPTGEDILCVYLQSTFWYQHVKLLSGPKS